MSASDVTNQQMLEILMQAIETIKEEGRKNKEELKQEIQTENQKLIKKLNEQDTKITKLSEKYDQLEIRCSNIEKFYRKNNLIIFGLELPVGSNILKYTIAKLNDILGLQLQDSDINNIYTLRSNKTPPIKIEFLSYLKKDLVLQNRNKLKGTRIFIAHDLTIQEREERKILVKHMKLARSKNYLANINGKVLKINDEVYTLEQLREIDRRQEEPILEEGTPTEDNPLLTNSAPSTPTLSDIHISQLFSLTKNINTKSTNQSEKRTKSTPADPNKEREIKRIPRTFSNSSARSDTTDRVTRNKQARN